MKRPNLAQPNDRVLLMDPEGKQYMLSLRTGQRLHTSKGVLDHDALIGSPYGSRLRSHLGHTFILLRPTIHDQLMRLKRHSQIVYPKEIGQILLKLDIGPGRRVIEAGTGSGALTMALAHAVRPDGAVYSYDCRQDMLDAARRNLELVGLLDGVSLRLRDIAKGFDETEADALFLDVREPWEYLAQVCAALADGGCFGALVPTTNQIVALLEGMALHPFILVEVLELFVRHLKPVPGRLRPADTMVGHTGYLIFARKVQAPLPDEAPSEPQAKSDDALEAPLEDAPPELT
ncbi:MAG: tRNA (adenine-N1)-methyltransferase [Chloroflexota bacterium]